MTMQAVFSFVTLAASAVAVSAADAPPGSVYKLSAAVPASAGAPVLEAFVSYSIEFAFFPDFAGNKSAPNAFTDALLTNLGNLAGGVKPYLRVGGNTQDYALYNASLPYAVNGTYNASRSVDYPTTVHIGPSYFESYGTLPGVRFSHGFNLALAPTPAGWQTLLDTVPLLCQALGPDKVGNGSTLTRRRLYTLEYGNEPDLLSTSAQGPTRPPSWNESAYVAQWLNGTRQIRQLLQTHCPELVRDTRANGSSALIADYAGFMAPSFAGVSNHLRALPTWKAGLDADKDIALFSGHNYISGATSPGVTLQGTLMNHSNTVRAVEAHVAEYQSIFGNASAAAAHSSSPAPRHIIGETNSLYNEGKPGLSNAFGAALWGVDFLLYCAAAGLGRVHMHQGTSFRYASWQPVATPNATLGTKPPYYGNVAVAAALGDTRRHNVSVAVVESGGRNGTDADREVAYAVYVDGRLARALALNLHAHNTTVNGTGLGVAAGPPTLRPSRNFTFALGSSTHARSANGTVLVQRLLANGSDAISGVTWDGWSYNAELAGGKPVRLANVTVGERLPVSQDGRVTVSVPDSSAALLHF